MTSNPAWSICEAAILLDNYLDSVQKGLPKLRVAKSVSEELRKMAANSAVIVNDSFRSVSGITDRLNSMECAYMGIDKESVHASELFLKIIDLYKNNRSQYERILSEASTMITMRESSKEQFINWVYANAPDHKTNWLESNLQRIESFCHRRNYTFMTIYDITDNDILQKIRFDIGRDKIFRLSCGKVFKNVLADYLLYCRYRAEAKETCDDMAEENESFKPIDKSATAHVDLQFSLDTIPDLTFTKPISFSYMGRASENVKSWSKLYTGVLRNLGTKCIDVLQTRFGKSDFSPNGAGMRRPIEICGGVYTELNFSAIDLAKRLKVFFDCCDISPKSLVIEYRRNEAAIPPSEKPIPDAIRKTIRRDYASGMRFDDTVLRLLSDKTDIEIGETLADLLREEMFKRGDGLYFLPEMIANQEVTAGIKADLLGKLNQYALCEVRCLYESFCAKTPSHCLRGEDDYADFLQYLLPDAIRKANIYGITIIKEIDVSISEATTTLVQNLVNTISENGCLTEEELLTSCPVVSGKFLRKLLEKNANEVVVSVINEILCYQTIEAMGFGEDFSTTLNTVLQKIDALFLAPSQEALNVLLSVEIGQNFREAYGIPDEKTFRRIVTMYYTGEKVRIWKAGKFMEE